MAVKLLADMYRKAIDLEKLLLPEDKASRSTKDGQPPLDLVEISVNSSRLWTVISIFVSFVKTRSDGHMSAQPG